MAQIRSAKQRQPWKLLLNKYFLVGVAFLVWMAFFHTNSAVEMIRAKEQIRQQEKEIEFYEKEIEDMDEHLDNLRFNRDTLEKFARETYFYHEDGEDVYIVR